MSVFPVIEIRQPDQPALFVSIRGPIEVGRECRGLLLADPQISRRHLSLDVVDGQVVVVDLGSTNGSALDGERITERVVLGVGQVVTLGGTSIRLDAPQPDRVVIAEAEHHDHAVDVGATTTMAATDGPVGAPTASEPDVPDVPDVADGDSPWAPTDARGDAVDPLLSPPSSE